ncbi:amino acid adenylation domain-containing protein [Pectobacterium betavasculorum]|uniref:non-ribosomal peptide synthetase n=1 Tax=Pectobacterium betavasculorum TaxID=55207 RepID=UPI00313D07D0
MINKDLNSSAETTTITFPELLIELGKRGVALRREVDNIKLRADKTTLDPTLLASLREHKSLLLAWIGESSQTWKYPESALVDLSEQQRARIVQHVAGGDDNVQDIYPLTPLQEGIFFHHLASENAADPYILPWLMAFSSREELDRFTAAMQMVIDRHDMLRSAIAWEGLPAPVQVVWRQAALTVEDIVLSDEDGDAQAWLMARFIRQPYRLDLMQAPLMRAFTVQDRQNDRWLVMLLCHHLAIDHTTLDFLVEEVQACLRGEADSLPTPLPFKQFVVQSRLAASDPSHKAFFRQMLAGIDEPTAPYGFVDVQGDGSMLTYATRILGDALCARLRASAKARAVSPASLFHVAWAIVLARLSERDDVVFGTVLFGRMQAGEGAGRVLGACVNTLPLRINIGAMSLIDTIRETHILLSELLSHEHAPLALAQACSQVPVSLPLFSAGLNYRYSQRQRALAASQQADWAKMDGIFNEERGNYPLHVEVDDFGDSFAITTHVHRPMDPKRVARYLETALIGVTDALENEPTARVNLIDILPDEERRELLVAWNDTATAFPDRTCIHTLFEEQAARTPQAPAVVYGQHTIAYADLNAQANRLAHYLCAQGVGVGTYVAISLPRSPEMVVAILAVLKAGAAYIPLDTSYPIERLLFMLRDSAAAVLITDRHSRGALGELPVSLTVIEMDGEQRPWLTGEEENLDADALGLTPDAMAYVIYTSGSTGTPKGVPVPHRGLCNLITAEVEAFAVTPHSRGLQFASFCFDASVSELFIAFVSGAALYLPPAGPLVGAELIDMLNRDRITHVTLPPAVLSALPEGTEFPDLQTLVLVGEEVSEALVRQWAPGRRFINGYGPTEATIGAAMHVCDPQREGKPPIGRPFANVRIYILDAQGRLAPVGVAGHLHVAGAGVTPGYLNRPELTVERFITDPFSDEQGARLYKTGDLGRWLPDGTIEFLGRSDRQVKIRGFRIELGEIEACIRFYPGVQDAVVLAREDVPGDRRLVGYYTVVQDVEEERLHEFLAQRLPDYMMPSAYVRLDSLPLTPNAKVDRAMLPAPEQAGVVKEGFEPPQGAVEKMLAGVWAKVLNRPQENISRDDNFFELGGHSLRLVEVASLLQELGLNMTVSTLFTQATVRQLAESISHDGAPAWANGAIPFRVKNDAVPLFFVHEVWGELLYVPEILTHIDSDISVYGLAGQHDRAAPIDSLRGHAANLIRVMRSVQLHGPYRLAGWSFGGVLAYEIACQLLEQGAEVAFLGLLDSANPVTQAITLPDDLQDVTRLWWALTPLLEPAAAQRIAALTETAAFGELVKAFQAESVLPARMSAEQALRYLDQYEGYIRALADWRPQPLAVPLHLFRVSDDRAPLLGWDNVNTPSAIRVIPVKGTHMSMVSRPYVNTLGEALTHALRAIEQGKR